MPSTKDVWVYAAEKVKNKGVLARMGHSARLHSVRSAFNSGGSFASKGLSVITAVGRASFNLIPLPIFSSLLSSAETAIEKKLRSWSHARSGRDKTAHVDYVKFQLKELSVENFDRYRWKVEESTKEMVKAGKAFEDSFNAVDWSKKMMMQPCAQQYEAAYAIAQCERRQKIFEDECMKFKVLMEASIAWAAASKASIVDYKNRVGQKFLDIAKEEDKYIQSATTPAFKATVAAHIKAIHAECGEFCVHKDNMTNTNWDKFREGAAYVVRNLQEPFSPETFLASNQASYTVKGQFENYGGAKDT
jgi:hypothetical protein